MYELFEVRLVGVANHTKRRRPLQAFRSPAPFLSSDRASGDRPTQKKEKGDRRYSERAPYREA